MNLVALCRVRPGRAHVAGVTDAVGVSVRLVVRHEGAEIVLVRRAVAVEVVIAAVWLAHVTAIRAFGTRKAALLSQIPMILLMISYTIFSLWILAQPVVGPAGG